METLLHELKDFFIRLENPILQAFVGGLFIWMWVIHSLGFSIPVGYSLVLLTMWVEIKNI